MLLFAGQMSAGSETLLLEDRADPVPLALPAVPVVPVVRVAPSVDSRPATEVVRFLTAMSAILAAQVTASGMCLEPRDFGERDL